MARPKHERANGATQAEQASAETHLEQTPQPEPQGDGSPENHATVQEAAQPDVEPGPEDFARHTGSRLIQDHEQDMRLLDDLQRRLEKRAHEIATRTRKKGANAVVPIGGKMYQPRAKPGTNGETMILAELKDRFSASID